MTDDNDENGEERYEISCSLGTLSLTVSGNDPDWVDETFAEKWQERLEESEEIEKALRDGSRIHQ